MKLELNDKDVENLKETIYSLFENIWCYNNYREEEFDVECVWIHPGEFDTLVKIAKQIFTIAEIYELNTHIDIPEAKIKI